MRALLLVLPIAALAGCTFTHETEAHLLLAVTTVDVTEGASVAVDNGYHCDGSSWSDAPPEAHLFPYDGGRPALVLARNVTTSGVGTFGQGRVWDVGEGKAGEMAVRSLVGGQSPLARVSWTEDGVAVDGEPLEVGTTRRLGRVHELEGGARANETMVLWYVGPAQVSWKAAGPGFACM